MPAPPARIREEDFVPLSQLYGRWARVFTDDGAEITPASVAWHENDLAQQHRSDARGTSSTTTGSSTRSERVDAARAAGGDGRRPARAPVRDAARLTRRGARRSRRSRTRSAACASTRARACSTQSGAPIDGLYAAGVDAGGVATGGYASGLAQALVLGLAAAEDARVASGADVRAERACRAAAATGRPS